jgi:hypothetical protein
LANSGTEVEKAAEFSKRHFRHSGEQDMSTSGSGENENSGIARSFVANIDDAIRAPIGAVDNRDI